MDLFTQLTTNFPTLQFKQEEPLAKYSHVKIGGPAEVFIEIKQKQDLVKLLKFCIDNQIKYYLLGWGANTLISDRGLRGLVIRNAATSIEVMPDQNINASLQNLDKNLTPARWQKSDYSTDFQNQFQELEAQEKDASRIGVEIDAGTPLPVAINQLLRKGISGLEWYAKIPATLGGAIYNNIHGGGHFIGEVVSAVEVMNHEGKIKRLIGKELEFGYDSSRFHRTDEVILSAELLLFQVETKLAQELALNWSREKAHQPQKSLGCVFQNIDKSQANQLELDTTSAGYIIDQLLNLKNFAVGDAQISSEHAAFIINKGQATAKDYLNVIRHVQQTARKKLDIFLKPEIFFLGFTDQELKGIISPAKETDHVN